MYYYLDTVNYSEPAIVKLDFYSLLKDSARVGHKTEALPEGEEAVYNVSGFTMSEGVFVGFLTACFLFIGAFILGLQFQSLGIHADFMVLLQQAFLIEGIGYGYFLHIRMLAGGSCKIKVDAPPDLVKHLMVLTEGDNRPIKPISFKDSVKLDIELQNLRKAKREYKYNTKEFTAKFDQWFVESTTPEVEATLVPETDQVTKAFNRTMESYKLHYTTTVEEAAELKPEPQTVTRGVKKRKINTDKEMVKVVGKDGRLKKVYFK